MKTHVTSARFFSAMVAALLLHDAIAQVIPPGPPHRFNRPAPTNELQKIQHLLHVWKMQSFVALPTPSWESEIPEPERNALKEAARNPSAPGNALARELVRQASTVSLNPANQASADRLFVLAAREGAIDSQELSRISLSSPDSWLREHARKLLLLSSAHGQPYARLSALRVPLPDLSRFLGKPVVIVFWAASDMRFKREWPRISPELDDLAKTGYAIVGINFDPLQELAEDFIQQHNIQWPTFYPKGHPLRYWEDYCVALLPAFWMVDSDGRLSSTGICCDLRDNPALNQ